MPTVRATPKLNIVLEMMRGDTKAFRLWVDNDLGLDADNARGQARVTADSATVAVTFTIDEDGSPPATFPDGSATTGYTAWLMTVDATGLSGTYDWDVDDTTLDSTLFGGHQAHGGGLTVIADVAHA